MKKKVVILFVTMVFLVGLVLGCGQSTSGEGEANGEGTGDVIRIGFAVNDFNDKWVSYMIDAVKEWDEANPDVEVTLGNGESDVQTQMAIVEDWITQGYDAVCVKPVEVEATRSLALQAEEAGVYYVAIQQGIEEATARCLQDSVKTGIDQMEAVVELLGGKGKVAMMVGELGTLVATERIDGNKQVIEKYPDIELVAEESGNWQRDQGMAIMENWLQAGIEIDAIVASNDEMAIGAILALEDVGKVDDYIIAGIDCTPDAIEYLENGSLDVTMYADAAAIAEGSLELAMKLIKDGSAEDVVIQDVIVYPEDAEKYK